MAPGEARVSQQCVPCGVPAAMAPWVPRMVTVISSTVGDWVDSLSLSFDDGSHASYGDVAGGHLGTPFPLNPGEWIVGVSGRRCDKNMYYMARCVRKKPKEAQALSVKICGD